MSDPNQQWQPPPPPPFVPPTTEPAGPEMSTPQTLSGIFFEPSRTFEALRTRPRFLVAGLILLLLTIGVTALVFQRIDMGEYIRQKMEQNPRNANQTEEQKEMGVKIGKIAGAVGIPISVPITIAAGAALYLLGVMAFGGSIGYKRSLAVWTYSSFPPAILGTIIAVLVLFLKAADTVDPEHLLVTNPGAFMGTGSSPVVVSVLSQFDVLRFYGLFLAAIGLRKVAKISSGSAWGIVIGFFLIRAILGISAAAIFGG
ncbi:MAG TPA: Yip1 family protein [Pyrinomonadaceae bacterium]|nr:Yip1 family protein [Pyrinomonadaceae bacterium]